MKTVRASGRAVVAVIVFLIAACDTYSVPEVSRLDELRRRATSGVGDFRGRVHGPDSTGRCSRQAPGIAGVLVEVGTWDGIPIFYRDTITREVPQSLNEPRFQLLAAVVTDSTGRFAFTGMPRDLAYAFRVVPPAGSGRRVTYGASLYGIGNVTGVDHPFLCAMPTSR
jgi:hypothetical protein